MTRTQAREALRCRFHADPAEAISCLKLPAPVDFALVAQSAAVGRATTDALPAKLVAEVTAEPSGLDRVLVFC